MAAEWGYANQAVPAAELEQVVAGMARDMAKVPASLLQLKKAAINRGVGPSRLSRHSANRGV